MAGIAMLEARRMFGTKTAIQKAVDQEMRVGFHYASAEEVPTSPS